MLFSGKTTTFAFTVAKEFESWALEDKDRYPVCVDQNVKVIAFYVGCKVNMIYLDTLINAFRMKHDGNEYFLQMIQSYLEKKKYKEVIIIIIIFISLFAFYTNLPSFSSFVSISF